MAAAMALTVAYPHMTGVGGDLFALLRRPDGSRVERQRQWCARLGGRGRSRPPVPVTGSAQSVTVPGAVSGWARLLELGGSLPVADLLAPAIGLAEDGVPVSRGLAAAIAKLGAGGTASPQLLALLDGAERRGRVLRQPALAGTLRTLADEGLTSMYDGTVADRLATGSRTRRPRDRAPTCATTRSCRGAVVGLTPVVRVSTSPPNSQGYLLLTLLAACERLGRLGASTSRARCGSSRVRSSAATAELADPRYVRRGREELLDPGRLFEARPRRRAARRATGDTVAVTAVAADGTAVSLIQSLFHSFGSQVLEPETGVVLHNRGSMFSADPASPNHPAPGKRPAHTLMPVLVEHADGRVSAHGAMGGRAQPQIHLQVLRNVLAGMSPAGGRGGAAARRPRRRRPADPDRRPSASSDRPCLAAASEVGHAMVCTLWPDGSLAAGHRPPQRRAR